MKEVKEGMIVCLVVWVNGDMIASVGMNAWVKVLDNQL